MTPEPVQLRVAWSVLPQQAVSVGAAAHSVMRASRWEQGCVTCSLATEMAARVTLTLVEVWESEASLLRHLASPSFEALAWLLESAVDAPRVECTLGDGRCGFASAQEVREQLLHHAPGA